MPERVDLELHHGDAVRIAHHALSQGRPVQQAHGHIGWHYVCQKQAQSLMRFAGAVPCLLREDDMQICQLHLWLPPHLHRVKRLRAPHELQRVLARRDSIGERRSALVPEPTGRPLLYGGQH